MMNNITYSTELYHYGIKGQKWGERRYQNEDGSLTPAGRDRYGVSARTSAKDYAKYKKYDAKAKKYAAKVETARTRRGRIRANDKAEAYKMQADEYKRMSEAKNMSERYWEAHGMKKREAMLNAYARQQDYRAKNARTKHQRAAASSQAYNARTNAEIAKKVRQQQTIGKKIVTSFNATMNSKYETIGGRHLNGGKMYGDAIIAAAANVVLPGSGVIYYEHQQYKGYRQNRH